MQQKTTLATSIDNTEQKAKYDDACKRLLAEKIILAWIMKHTMEAQNDFYPGYPLIKRGIYYCARMISSQYGTVFTQSHYEKIQKVYSVWICTNPPQKRRNTITEYSLTEKQHVGNMKENKEYYDLMNAIMVCLGSEEDGGGGRIYV